MKELRTLLIDCRIELRKHVRDFHKTELCERLDKALLKLANAVAEAEPAAAEAASDDRKSAPNQVALAWQTAARDLKFSDPALYESLSKKVMARLEAKALVDQTTELRQLEEEISQFKVQMETAERTQHTLTSDRNQLLGALAEAVPGLGEGNHVELALARIEWLKAQVARSGVTSTTAVIAANTAGTVGTAAAGSAAATPGDMAANGNVEVTPAAPVVIVEVEPQMPSDTVLQAVAAGGMSFTEAQRECCVGEATVLTSFRISPTELLAQGDSEIARVILAARLEANDA